MEFSQIIGGINHVLKLQFKIKFLKNQFILEMIVLEEILTGEVNMKLLML